MFEPSKCGYLFFLVDDFQWPQRAKPSRGKCGFAWSTGVKYLVTATTGFLLISTASAHKFEEMLTILRWPKGEQRQTTPQFDDQIVTCQKKHRPKSLQATCTRNCHRVAGVDSRRWTGQNNLDVFGHQMHFDPFGTPKLSDLCQENNHTIPQLIPMKF